MKFMIYPVSFMMILSCTHTTTFPGSGVPYSLAENRHSQISGLEYHLDFNIPDDQTKAITASEVILFDYAGKSDVFLDFKESPDKLIKMSLNGQPLPIKWINEHIVLPKVRLQKKNKLEIDFIAGNLSLNRNDDYLYTLLVPDRARTVFPVMDQPNLKASWTLTLHIPEDWEAVANGHLLQTTTSPGRKTLAFGKTKPVSSYLFAFAAGKFQKISNESGDMTMYYRESDTLKVARNTEEIFTLHQQSLDWLEDYTGITYPFEKFDFALIPTFQYGGMEHPGAIFYRESALMLDESPSINQKLRRASLIAHETAHMWFGDLVTMTWFDDVWLKEVFANFMAAKIVHPSFPEINHELRFLLSHYPAAYEIDRSEGTHPIQQPLDNLQNAGSVYGAIIYQKAPVVMRNLERILGEQAFREGLQEYLKTYAYSNATWDDLIGILARHTTQDLGQWNHDWVKSPGMPEIKSWIENGKMNYQTIKGDSGQIWQQDIQTKVGPEVIHFSLNNHYQHEIDQNLTMVNSDGRAYGYFNLPLNELNQVMQFIQQMPEMERAAGQMMLWESVIRGNIKASTYYHYLLETLAEETNPLILEYLTGNLQTLFWNLLSPSDREQTVADLEAVLFRGMLNPGNPSLQRTYFHAYTNVVLSETGIHHLRQIWADQLPDFTLPLSENEKIRLTLQLAVRDVSDAGVISTTQLEKTENPDNRKRLEFIIPAVSNNPAIRDSFFTSLLDAENRSQEPWVSEALSYLNHPLRSAHSIKYLPATLEVIEEIKTTGDIFFPKAWLDASLGGHRSKEAAKIVQDFLTAHPHLPADLKNKILQSADLLQRIQGFAD